MQVHGLGVASGHDQGCALAVLGADRAEDIGGGGSLVFGGARTRAAFGPTAGDLVLLADPSFVGEPDLYRAGIDSLLAPDLFQAGGEAYGMARPSLRRLGSPEPEEEGLEMRIAVLGVDLGKNVCSVAGLDGSRAVVLRRRAKRETLIALAAKLPPCVVAMEACCGAHHLGRVFASHGHEVRLMSPEYVRPYIKAQKNDDRDAEGIAEAATRPTMRFVELKSQDQFDMQTLHRSRDRLVGNARLSISCVRSYSSAASWRPRASASSNSSWGVVTRT